MSRLTLLHINIIGAVVCVIVGVALYFTLITSAQDQVTKSEGEFRKVEERANKYDTNKRALETAKLNQLKAQQDYALYEKQFMPTIGYQAFAQDEAGSERLKTMMRLFWPNRGKSWPEKFIKMVRGHMAREQKANGIVWENPGVIALPAYGPDPNTIEIARTGEGLGPVLHYGSYQMSVRARSLDALMRHIRAWNSARSMGVPTVEGLSIQGNSPNLRATYMLTLTIILRDKERDLIPPQNSRISGSGGGGGGGGGMMGAMGSGGMGGMGGMGGPGAGAPMTSRTMGGMGSMPPMATGGTMGMPMGGPPSMGGGAPMMSGGGGAQ